MQKEIYNSHHQQYYQNRPKRIPTLLLVVESLTLTAGSNKFPLVVQPFNANGGLLQDFDQPLIHPHVPLRFHQQSFCEHPHYNPKLCIFAHRRRVRQPSTPLILLLGIHAFMDQKRRVPIVVDDNVGATAGAPVEGLSQCTTSNPRWSCSSKRKRRQSHGRWWQ